MTRTGFLAAGLGMAGSLLTRGADREMDKEKLEFFEREEVAVKEFSASGFVLDIGGGGEGVIGQMKGSQVVAIDLSKRELEGAPGGPLKIVMDATDLKFLDASFETVTAFYSFMYMAPEVREKVLVEMKRVLRPGGRFLLWDVEVPARTDPTKEMAVFRFSFRLPDREIKTGYGTPYREYRRDMAYHIGFAERAGFRVVSSAKTGRSFFVEFRTA